VIVADSVKKNRKHRSTFLFKDAVKHRRFIREVLGKKVDDAAASPLDGISRTEDNRSNPCIHNSPGTHGARLERYKKGATFQAPISHNIGSLPDSLDFGMGSGVVLLDTAVSAGANNLSRRIADYTPYRDFIAGCSFFSKRECSVHICFSHRGISKKNGSAAIIIRRAVVEKHVVILSNRLH
jgi:hypothetical protein